MTRQPFEIETAVPAPATRYGRGAFRQALEALARAEIGSSFFIPDGTHGSSLSAGRMAQTLFGSGWYSLRKVEGGQRIWKIAEPKKNAETRVRQFRAAAKA